MQKMMLDKKVQLKKQKNNRTFEILNITIELFKMN